MAGVVSRLVPDTGLVNVELAGVANRSLAMVEVEE
jgi:hypothetical protein